MSSLSSESIVTDFLTRHRHEPPERDGWFGSYDISRGVRRELGVRIIGPNLYPALGRLLVSVPPKIEDAWMLSDGDGNPILDQQYEHSSQPKEARRFYRILETSVEAVAPIQD